MDLQFWIYIIVAIVWVLARALRKAPAEAGQPEERERREVERDSSGNGPLTFEELLREIQQAKTPPKPVTQELPRPSSQLKTAPPIKPYNEVDYDDDLQDEEQDLETIPTRETSYEVYEKAKQDAFYRPSLEETMKLSDTEMKFGHFKEYEETVQKSQPSEILRDFKDPEGFKKAFIMSEILKRKF